MQTGASTDASEMQTSEARVAALLLLRRSVALKHDRLAIIRLTEAVKLDAIVDSGLWDYCGTVACVRTNLDQFQRFQAAYRNSPSGLRASETHPR